MKRFVFTVLLSIALGINCFAQNPILMDFSGDSAEANGVTLMGAGFGEYPMPDVSFGDIPTDNAFDGATDGRGMIITADPGEGVMVLTQPILSSNCALIRCSIRLSAPHASLYLASVDQGESEYVSTITPNNPSSFVGRYKRIADFFLPPSTCFQGIIQILNTSKTEPLTVYLDNLEVLESGSDLIEFTLKDVVGGQVQPTPTVTPIPVATPTLTPTVTPTRSDVSLMVDREIMQFGSNDTLLNSVAYSPDGKYLLTGSNDNNKTFLWDIDTGKIIRTFYWNAGQDYSSTYSVAISPDGSKVLTGSSDQTAKLWDAASRKLIRTFSGHTGDVLSVLFSPDGSKVLTRSHDKTAKLWDVITGEEIRTFFGSTKGIVSIAYSPDGSKILTGNEDKTAILWDIATGTKIHIFSEVYAQSVAFSLDGNKVLIGNKLYYTVTGNEIGTLPINWVRCSAFSPDGKKIVSCGSNTVELWNADTGSLIRTLAGHTDIVLSVLFSPDGSKIVTVSADKTMKLWDANTGEVIRTFVRYSSYSSVYSPVSAVFSPDGSKVLTANHDKTAKMYDVVTGEEIRTFWNTGGVLDVVFSPDGLKVLMGSDDKTAHLWNVATGTKIRSYTGHTDSVNSVAISPDGSKVLTGSADKTAKLWNVDTGEIIQTFYGFSKHSASISSVAFSPDGSKILTGSSDKTAKLWDIDSGSEIYTFSGHTGSVSPVAFSPTGTTVWIGTQLLNVASGDEIASFQLTAGRTVTIVAFSPDGTKVLSLPSGMESVKLWDISDIANLNSTP